MKYGNPHDSRDPLDAYREHSDWEDERLLTPRELVEKAAREAYGVEEYRIGEREFANLLVWRFSAEWREQIGDRTASWSEAEFALREAIDKAFGEMREVRALQNEGDSITQGSDQGGPAGLPPSPSARLSFWSRLRRVLGGNPWL